MNFDKKYLKKTWNENLEQADLIAEYFYDILFHEFEGTEELFNNTEIHFQKMEFQKAITNIINNLDDPDKVETYLKESGIRHICYGIVPKYYKTVESALFKTFEQVFKDCWSQKMKEQWQLFINFILETMKKGALEIRPDLSE
ncbi:MAG: globin domain-containing protein [Bacteriovoracaceae bacterium]